MNTIYQNCLEFVILCSNRWLKMEVTAREKKRISAVYWGNWGVCPDRPMRRKCSGTVGSPTEPLPIPFPIFYSAGVGWLHHLFWSGEVAKPISRLLVATTFLWKCGIRSILPLRSSTTFRRKPGNPDWVGWYIVMVVTVVVVIITNTPTIGIANGITKAISPTQTPPPTPTISWMTTPSRQRHRQRPRHNHCCKHRV